MKLMNGIAALSLLGAVGCGQEMPAGLSDGTAALSTTVLTSDPTNGADGWAFGGADKDPADYTATPDSSALVDGRPSERIEGSTKVPPGHWTTWLSRTTNGASLYAGKRLRLRTKMRTENAHTANVWFRLDAPGGTCTIDNMSGPHQITGTTPFTEYALVLDAPPDMTRLNWGFILGGEGKVWGGLVTIEVVGRDVPVTETHFLQNNCGLQ